MTNAQLEKCHKHLEQILTDMVEPPGRRERRHGWELRKSAERPASFAFHQDEDR